MIPGVTDVLDKMKEPLNMHILARWENDFQGKVRLENKGKILHCSPPPIPRREVALKTLRGKNFFNLERRPLVQ